MFNEILVGRFNSALNKWLGIKAGAPAPSLAGDIVANVQVEGTNIISPDLRALLGWKKYGFYTRRGPTVGQNSGIRLRNPVGSNVIAVIENLTVQLPQTSAAATQIQILYGQINVNLTTAAATNRVLDGRWTNTTFTSTLIASTMDNPVSLNNQQIIKQYGDFAAGAQLTFDVIFIPDQEFVLSPGDAIQIQSNSTNCAIDATIWWRERVLEDSELAL